MTMYVNRTMILPAANAPLARALAAHLAGPPGEGMWVVGLSADGTEPATHYVSSGDVAEEFGPLLTDADALWGAVQAAMQTGMAQPANAPALTQATCEALVAAVEVVKLEDESPFDTFARLGLELVRETEE